MINTKKFLSVVTSIAIVLFFNTDSAEANECGSGIYVISAYYSPVPGQARYATGTYEGDIRLNGGGVTTASGVKVADAPGSFVAGPPCFTFGTILEIDDLGAHVVLDRGGAIKGNRLDIWMGYGDVGLANALSWGKRPVFVRLVSGELSVSSFNYNIGKSTLKTYQEVKSNDPFEFLRGLAFGDTGEDVARLQQMLKDTGFFRSEVNGVYDNNTKLAVESFNLSAGVLKNGDLNRAGRFGGDSIVKLKDLVAVNRQRYLDSPKRNLGRGSRGDDVLKLQRFLLSLGLIDNISGVYDSDTVRAVIAFQIAEGIILTETEQGAGYFGPMTQMAFDKVAASLDPATSSVAIEEVALTELDQSELITDSLAIGSSGDQVIRLQQLLKDINLFRLEPTGYFGPVTANAVFNFQRRVGVLIDINDSSAGFVGPATRNALNSYLNKRHKFMSNLTNISSTVQLSSVGSFYFDRDLDMGMNGEDVRKLQEFLKVQGYFNGTIITDFFGPVTKSSLIKFKIDNKLPNSNTLPTFDASTRSFINDLI
jgi:peptidoglycan hydrolase-like protein with peptidoglycan-binding domain/3D (Asp-Asp-Asp) domain-containing protein